MRDLSAIGTKIVQVLNPTAEQAVLRDWDLWGPLIVSPIPPSHLSTILLIPYRSVLPRFGRTPFSEWSVKRRSEDESRS